MITLRVMRCWIIHWKPSLIEIPGELLRVFELESRPPAQNFGVDDTYLFYVCDATYSGETKVYWMKKEDLLKPEAKFQMMEP